MRRFWLRVVLLTTILTSFLNNSSWAGDWCTRYPSGTGIECYTVDSPQTETDPSSIHTDGTSTTSSSIPFALGIDTSLITSSGTLLLNSAGGVIGTELANNLGSSTYPFGSLYSASANVIYTYHESPATGTFFLRRGGSAGYQPYTEQSIAGTDLGAVGGGSGRVIYNSAGTSLTGSSTFTFDALTGELSVPSVISTNLTASTMVQTDANKKLISSSVYPVSAGGENTVLISNGASFTNSSVSYPSTTTASQILYSTATNAIGGSANLTFDGSIFKLGVDGTGIDSYFYSDTPGSNLFWDNSESQLTLTIQPGKAFAFNITGTDTTRANPAYLYVNPTISYTGQASGANPINAIKLSLTDSRIINQAAGADYLRVMDFVAARGAGFSSVETLNYVVGQYFNLKDVGTYSANNTYNLYGIWLYNAGSGADMWKPKFTGSTATVRNYGIYDNRIIDEHASTVATVTGTYSSFYSYPGMNFNTGTHNVYLFYAAPSYLGTESTAVINAVGFYYDGSGSYGLTTEYAFKAITSDGWMASDNGAWWFGAGKDVEILHTGTYWDFDIAQATTAIRFNNSKINTDFEVYGDDRAVLHLDAQAASSYFQANTDSTTALIFKDAGGNSDVIYDSTNGRLGVGGTPDALFDVAGLSRAQTLVADGDGGGTASTTSFTNATAINGEGTFAITARDGGSTENAGWIKVYVGTTAVYIPYAT